MWLLVFHICYAVDLVIEIIPDRNLHSFGREFVKKNWTCMLCFISPSSAFSTEYDLFEWLTYLNYTYISKYRDNFNLLSNLYRLHLLIGWYLLGTEHEVMCSIDGVMCSIDDRQRSIAVNLHCITLFMC